MSDPLRRLWQGMDDQSRARVLTAMLRATGMAPGLRRSDGTIYNGRPPHPTTAEVHAYLAQDVDLSAMPAGQDPETVFRRLARKVGMVKRGGTR